MREDGMQVELAYQGDVAGPVDTSSPNVFTEKELHALKVFVTRYRALLENVKTPKDMAIIVVPNVAATNPTIPENERTLGSEVDSVVRKVFELNRQGSGYLATKATFASAKSLAEQFALLAALASQTPTLRSTLQELRGMQGVVSLHPYIFTQATASYILKLYDHVIRVSEKNSQGLGKAVGDKKPAPRNFPQLTETPVPAEIQTKALPKFDELSTLLPQENIFREGNKKSAGGWRMWSCDQEGVYVATLYSLTTMAITSRRIVDAIADVFARIGIKACVQLDTKVKKQVVTVVFTLEQLEAVDMAELKKLLEAEIKTYTFQKGASFVGSSTVSSPVHTPAQSTKGAAVSKSNSAGDQKRFEKK